MRACTLFGFLILGAAGLVAFTPNLTLGQPGGRQFGGGKGGKGGGAPGGNMMTTMDSGELFDFYAKGRAFFLISETRSLSAPLTQYAQEKGIANGQINRTQFVDFHTKYKTTMAAGGGAPFGTGGASFAPGGGNPFAGGGNPFGGKGKKGQDMGGPGNMMIPGGPPPNADMLNMQADALFQRMDKNGDGKLNQDEMPGPLRNNLLRFDKNGDGLIDLNEFREYFLARMTGDLDGSSGRGTTTIIDDDELDKRAVVLRAGKLPGNMPEWFKEYDLDNDGQVALWEWKKIGKKSLKEFDDWDLNDDGFITPEEALKHQAVIAKDNPKSGGGFGAFNAGGDPSGMMAKFNKGKKGGDPSNPGKGKKQKGGGFNQDQ